MIRIDFLKHQHVGMAIDSQEAANRSHPFQPEQEFDTMFASELHTAGRMIYGDGLPDWVYIRVLSRDLGIPERTIRRWWEGHPDQYVPAARSALDRRINEFMSSRLRAEDLTRHENTRAASLEGNKPLESVA
ncbi:MAG: hypothetical protein H7831_00745 [Magnetococcus sp. WYHC-3]